MGTTSNRKIEEEIVTAISEQDALWGGSKASLLAQTDDWFRQCGVIIPFVMGNTATYLLGCGLGIRDVGLVVNINSKIVELTIYLGWWAYHFKKRKILYGLNQILPKHFPDYDISITIRKYMGIGKNEQKTKK